MKKTRIIIFTSLLLACLLFILQYPIKSAKAINVALEWGHMRSNYDPVERDTEATTCLIINNRFNTAGWAAQNAYWDLTTRQNVLNTISWCQMNTAWATSFWVGDFFPSFVQGGHWEWQEIWYFNWETWQWESYWDWVWIPEEVYTKHYNMYGHAGDHISDIDVGGWTSWPLGYSTQRFDFIWTCANGAIKNEITGQLCMGYIDTDNNTGLVGMAYAWTGRNDLSLDGYHFPDSVNYYYIGFENTSKPLKEYIDGTGYTYSWFPYYFYDHALGWGGYHHTIYESLNYASQQIWGVPYDQCLLYTGYWDNYSWPGLSFYCRMRVFGNTNLYLPY